MIAAHEATIHFTKLGAAQTCLETIEVCERQAARTEAQSLLQEKCVRCANEPGHQVNIETAFC